MDSLRFLRFLLISLSILLVSLLSTVTAGDIVHQDDLAPKKPGCENDFVLVLKSLPSFFLSSYLDFTFQRILLFFPLSGLSLTMDSKKKIGNRRFSC